ncbi:MAG: hypothetical protein CVU50_08955 [Candidatus Cloacimonetes bacterium HGW-Cloacimonetes-3]|jgi:hypothetical protein|nr:MAG: hypothetical protein CVU50_08955 [Candidatus Cloacimonetes bacterium HGW-Cloacimonetes-3]
MDVLRCLIPEKDTTNHTSVIEILIELSNRAVSELKTLYFITPLKNGPLVYELKQNTTAKKLLNSTRKPHNSFFRWDSLSTLTFIVDNSLVLCAYLNPEELAVIDSKIHGNAEMYVVEFDPGVCKIWHERWKTII